MFVKGKDLYKYYYSDDKKVVKSTKDDSGLN